MTFSLPHGLPILDRTPAVLRAMLGDDLAAEWVYNNYGPDTFSPFDVVGHLIHGESTDWMPRVRRILEHGPRVAFEPFDRLAMRDASRGKSIGHLLDEFATLRSQNLAELRGLRLTDEQLALTGLHPALGVVTLSQLLATWVVHDLNHVHQIAKCMACQYREAIGPWVQYMGVYR